MHIPYDKENTLDTIYELLQEEEEGNDFSEHSDRCSTGGKAIHNNGLSISNNAIDDNTLNFVLTDYLFNI